ncbi:phage portal protein [Thermoanaerobacterium sp. CMT5567-10]|uniref:phage portal protein n=1 Tax=Thermoanaerobacterium sp. CMT5567-10 TaxID=3061989 RepID=UPI0026DFB9F6|nr:phage portal protein [Thermoanaerobacterium sp. CMT5567-10]WKV08188.1 phage portal protein [Thermoanaerobacterium sp. CMT5567-10]
MIDYMQLLKVDLQGLYTDQLERINKIIRWYEIYDGKQEWSTNEELDYKPTKKISNKIKELIDKKARFMFGKEPYFNLKPIIADERGSTINADKAQAKEDLLYKILDSNKFHSKLLKARKDCSIGGKIAIKLWAQRDIGLKIVFSPAQEFIPFYDVDDVDNLYKIIFVYMVQDALEPAEQIIKKQTWEMINGKCILNEGTYNGTGALLEAPFQNYNTGLDFIPAIIIQNGGLTGETEGRSDVELLWSNQDIYNRLTSDDIDALKFQMFGQNVFVDASEDSLKNIKIAPGAMIDLQSDISTEGKQAQANRLESNFSYNDKFQDTVNRIKNDMYDALSVPNIGLEQLKGLMQSGKSMKALYWDLISACEEDWTEWGPALEQMVDYIFKMVDVYNLYNARDIVRFDTTMTIEHTYPIPEDEADQQRLDLEKVTAQVMSRKAFIKKWQDVEDVDAEMEQIATEQQMLKDEFIQAASNELNSGD